MKKLLTLLGAITLIGTTSTNVVACGGENPIPSTRTDLSKIIKIFDLGNIYVGQLEKPNKKQILQAIINKNSSVNSLTESDFDFDGTPTANETKIKGTGNYKGEISLKFTISNFKCIYTNGLPISSSFSIVNIKENNNIIYVSTSIVGNIYKSTDNGTTFLPMSGINSLIRSLDIDKNGNIYAGSTNGIVYKSNGTDAFTAMTGSSIFISSLATNKNGNIYAGGKMDKKLSLFISEKF